MVQSNVIIEQEAKDQPSVNVNEVKKCWQVRTDDGFTFTVMDNKNGIIRAVQAVPGQHVAEETQEDYVFAWVFARESEESPWRPVVLTEQQRQKVARIKKEWLTF